MTAEPPEHLDSGELGTKRYWDDTYHEDLVNLQNGSFEDRDGRSLSSWFDEVNAPQKILRFLTDQHFPLAPSHFPSCPPDQCPSILDLGTGNGQTLLQLRHQGKFGGPMVGIDYSEASIQLARELAKAHKSCEDIKFEIMDILRDDPQRETWWPEEGFDLVLDKSTFDAISLSEDIIATYASQQSATNTGFVRTYTLYPARALAMVKPGGFLLVTSCNWTHEELADWFAHDGANSIHSVSVWKIIEYPKLKFGGREGQGVNTICFRKAARTGRPEKAKG